MTDWKEFWITFNEALPPHKLAIAVGIGFIVAILLGVSR
jgi:hypothetical protein